MKTSRISPSAPPEPQEAPGDLEEKIRRRAYERYQQRGRVEGHALDDWLQAEAEILEIKAKKKLHIFAKFFAVYLPRPEISHFHPQNTVGFG